MTTSSDDNPNPASPNGLTDEQLRRIINATPGPPSKIQLTTLSEARVVHQYISLRITIGRFLAANPFIMWFPDNIRTLRVLLRNLHPNLSDDDVDRYCELPGSQIDSPDPNDYDDFPQFDDAYRIYYSKIGESPDLAPSLVDQFYEARKKSQSTVGRKAKAIRHVETTNHIQEPAVSIHSLSRTPGSAVIGQDLTTNSTVSVEDEHRRRHISIIGKTGYGKTTLLEHLILEDLRTNTSAILIDPHGDLSHRIVSLASSEERSRITLLEVWPDCPFRLNLLSCPDPSELDRIVTSVVTLFHRLFDSGTSQYAPRLHRYLGNALRTLIPNGRALADVTRLFSDTAFRQDMLRNVQNRKVDEFWQFYDQLPDRERIIQLESTINRLDEFLSSPAAYAMVDSTDTTVPLETVLGTDGQLLLVRIPIGELGEQQARFYGSLFLSLLTDRLFARSSLPESARHRLHLYLDEYGWFATPITAALLQQARKYSLGATIAFQTLADLPDEKNKQAALQVGTFIVLQLVGQNAEQLATEFPVIPREQTEETVSETVGTKPILGPTQEPLSKLLANGHRNKDALQVVQDLLKPLTELQSQLAEAEGKQDRSAFYDYRIPLDLRLRPQAEEIRTGLDLINKLLVTGMERGRAATNIAAEITTDILLVLGRYYEFPFGPSTSSSDSQSEPYTNVPSFKPALSAYLRQAADATDPASHLENTPLSDLPWTLLKEELERIIDTEYYGSPLSPRVVEVRQQLDEACIRLRTDAAALLTLWRVLATDPIYVMTGQEEDDIRPRHIVHPAQTHADARLELAGALANLKEYTAYYQTPIAHGQVALSAPVEPGHVDVEAIRAVSERSKALYGRPIEQYSAAKAQPSPAPGPRIGRRPPGTTT
jgi:hypothetical protein